MNLPDQLYSAEQVRALDRVAINEFDIPGIELMERAGQAAFSNMCERWPDAKDIAVFCGAGNNAGDGFILARLAQQQGLNVNVYSVVESSRLKGDAKRAFEKMEQSHIKSNTFNETMQSKFDVIVDALLGTGLSGPVSGHYKAAIDWINTHKREHGSKMKVLALDIPSGLHADTGVVQGCAVISDLTVTFIGLKKGMLTADGPDHCGELVFNDLAVNQAVYSKVDSSVNLITHQILARSFPPRLRSSHKYDFGHALIIGGNDGMPGAVRMAAEAALRTGAGVVSVATRSEHVLGIISNRPEIMCHGVESHHQLKPLLEKATCVAIGPGLGQDAWADEIFARVLETGLPLVVDADALNLLVKDSVQRDDWILTPHPGEAARLLGTTSKHVQSDRFAAVESIKHKYGGAVILKGAGSLVIGLKNEISLCPHGNPGMSSAGMGDVLTGVVVSLVAQKYSMSDAAKLATVVHARAADLAAQSNGERGMVASDLFPLIRHLVN